MVRQHAARDMPARCRFVFRGVTPAAVAQSRPTGHVSARSSTTCRTGGPIGAAGARLRRGEARADAAAAASRCPGFAEGLLARRPVLDTAGRELGAARSLDGILRVQDANVELTEGQLDLLAGFGRVVWGRLDELQPTDVINPLDVSRFFFEGRSEARLPVALVARARLRPETTRRSKASTCRSSAAGRFDQLDEPTSPFNLVPAWRRPRCPSGREPRRATFGNAQGGARVHAPPAAWTGASPPTGASSRSGSTSQPFAAARCAIQRQPSPLHDDRRRLRDRSRAVGSARRGRGVRRRQLPVRRRPRLSKADSFDAGAASIARRATTGSAAGPRPPNRTDEPMRPRRWHRSEPARDVSLIAVGRSELRAREIPGPHLRRLQRRPRARRSCGASRPRSCATMWRSRDRSAGSPASGGTRSAASRQRLRLRPAEILLLGHGPLPDPRRKPVRPGRDSTGNNT